jgi:hypothetical protein
VAFGLDEVDGTVDDVAGEVLNCGKDLGEGDLAGGNDDGCVEATLAEREGEVDLDRFDFACAREISRLEIVHIR